MTLKRADRVADLIKAELSDILLKEVRDPRIGTVTITGVDLTADLRSAKIYFVRMGEDTSSRELQEALEKASGFIRRELGKRLQLRYIPTLAFVYDRSFEYGDKIERLLSQVRHEEDGTDSTKDH
jgi:ribosome-binding factor A